MFCVKSCIGHRRSLASLSVASGGRVGAPGRCATKRLVADRRQEKAPLDGGQRGFSDRKLWRGGRGVVSCPLTQDNGAGWTSRAFPKFESYGMSETAAFRGWKAQHAVERFHGIGRLGSGGSQQLGQLGDVGGDAPGFVAGEQVRRRV